MEIIVVISALIIPSVIFFIVVYGILHHTDVYDEFIEGAADGMKTVVGIAPTLVGLMAAVGILRASGFLDFLSNVLSIVTDKIGFPSQLVPLTIVRMFSSSAATGLALDVFKEYTYELYRNDILYDVSVFYGRQGKKNAVDSAGGIDSNTSRYHRKYILSKIIC